MLQRLKAIYWPESPLGDPLDTARRRSLIAFAVLGASCALAVGFVYFQKNFVTYPAQGATIIIVSALLIVSPFFMARCREIESTATLIMWLSFGILALMSMQIDGMISFKVVLLMPLAMVTTLTLGVRHGIAMGLTTILLYVLLHVSQARIGGNIANPLDTQATSFLLAVSLSLCLIFIVTGAAIFREQMRRTLRQLDRSNQLAAASSKAKSQFLATVSHELRTPLQGILGMNELLAKSGLSVEQQRYANTVDQSANLLLTMLNDVLEFSQTENGQLRIRNEPFNLRRMVEGIALQYGVDAERKGLQLVVHFSPLIPSQWRGDADRIRQVVCNLVTNAIKHTYRGHIDIRIGCQKNKRGVTIDVADTGIGIARQHHDLIFEQFTQLNRENDQQFGGTGLGLAICRSLVRAMRGDVSVTSEIGAGSTFTVTLPLVAQDDSADVVHTPPSNNLAIVADPLPSSLDALCEMLADIGWETVPCQSLEDADRSCQDASRTLSAPALIILDEGSATGRTRDWIIRTATLPGFERTRFVVLATSDEEQAGHPFSETALSVCRFRKPISLSGLMTALETPISPARALENSQSLAINRPRLLVAEDNEVNQMFLKHFLKKKSIDATFVENGALAVERMRSEPFDLVVMDIEMPVMDGIEATRSIRRFETINQREATTIVAVTASALAGDRERFLAAGINDYLAKPYRIEDFDALLTRWLPGLRESADG